MPLVEWSCYVTALPALFAEQTLRDAEAAALPWLSRTDRRRTLARLYRLAAGDEAAYGGTVDGMALRHAPPAPMKAHD